MPGSQQSSHVGSHHSVPTVASSAIASHMTIKQTTTFIPNLSVDTHKKMDEDVKNMLIAVTEATPEFITHLENVGFVTPAVIVNSFGNSARHIASMLGKTDQQFYHKTCFRNLVMFFCWQLKFPLNWTEVDASKYTKRKKRGSVYTIEFLAIDTDTITDMLDDYKDLTFMADL
jgi:hypothetical protein